MLPNNQYLILSFISPRSGQHLQQITHFIKQHGCSIAQARISAVGDKNAALMQISGNWVKISELKGLLPAFCKQHKLKANIQDAHIHHYQPDLISYHVQLVGADRPGILHKIITFLEGSKLEIEDIQVQSYDAHTGTSMNYITVHFNVDKNVHIASLREDFALYCDDHNLDGMMAPSQRVDELF